MKNESDILDKTKGGKIPFALPDGYFDNFTSELDKKIQFEMESKRMKKETKDVKIKALYNYVRPWAYVAAAVALLVFCVQLIISNQETLEASQEKTEINNVNSELLYTHLDDESIMDYLISEEE